MTLFTLPMRAHCTSSSLATCYWRLAAYRKQATGGKPQEAGSRPQLRAPECLSGLAGGCRVGIFLHDRVPGFARGVHLLQASERNALQKVGARHVVAGGVVANHLVKGVDCLVVLGVLEVRAADIELSVVSLSSGREVLEERFEAVDGQIPEAGGIIAVRLVVRFRRRCASEARRRRY